MMTAVLILPLATIRASTHVRVVGVGASLAA